MPCELITGFLYYKESDTMVRLGLGNNNMNNNNPRQFTCLVEFVTQFYPKNKKIVDGDWGIVTVRVKQIEVDGSMVGYNTINFNLEENQQYKMHIHSIYKTITMRGNMLEMYKDTLYKVKLVETYDSKFERWNYDIKTIQEIYDFDTEEKQRKFLLRIITEKQVDAIFNELPNPMEVLEQRDVERLKEVKGIGETTAERIIKKFLASKDLGKAMVELGDYGLTNNMILKLVGEYGSPDIAVAKVKNNPYILADEVDGIGFLKADEIAHKVGFDPRAQERCIAFIQYFFEQTVQEGHSYVEGDVLMASIFDTLGDDYPMESVSASLRYLTDRRKLWHNYDKTVFALTKYYNVERLVASNIMRLANAENNFYFENWEERIKEVEEKQGWSYTDEQFESIRGTLENNVVIITGYGGTGKTASVAGMLSVLGKDYKFAQCALSGKAGVNMTHVTGVEGHTIHRLLGYRPQDGFTYNYGNQLEHDIIILDELSMVDAPLFAQLLSAIKDGAKLIMLGDTGQLPNIGCGNVMHDLIESGYIAIHQLTKVHRQASKSAIITESIKLRNSEHIVNLGFEGRKVLGELQDLEIVAYKEREDKRVGEDGRGVDLIMKEYNRLRPQTDNIMDIAVLLPTNTRGTSTYKINKLIQDIEINHKQGLNARGLEIKGKYPYTLYIGDKVINTKNNYKAQYKELIGEDENGKPIYKKIERPIYNGNMGIVTSINHKDREVEIDFENVGKVTIDSDGLDTIQLGYAISIHKSQGATIPYTIMGLDYTHFKMLSRELVYTGITRAKKHCVLVAETRALRRATTTTNVITKQTFLPFFLDGQLSII